MPGNNAMPHCSNRMFEWSAATMLVQCGLLAIVSDLFLATRPQLAFMAFNQLGLTQIWTGLLFIFVGVPRLVALARNGQWKNGPMVRAVCAVAGAVIWGQLLWGIIEFWVVSGQVYLSITVWDTLLVFEGISFVRAMRDRKANAALRPHASLGASNGCSA